MKALALALVLAAPALADTTVSGDFQVTGQVGVGTLVPQARLEARMSAADAYGLKVSSSNGAVLTALDNAGRLGIGTLYPQARLDARGSGNNGSVGLWLRGGNSTSSLTSAQLAFGLASTDTYRHSIRTRHNLTGNRLNSINFFLWNSTNTPSTLGSLNVLSVEGSTITTSSASVHVMPFGIPDVELEVSNGVQTGGGTIQYASFATHSSRRLKSDIAPLSAADIQRAYEDVRALKHARFRYKPGKAGAQPSPETRGLIYEDTPESIHGQAGTLVFDYRLANLEMALKIVNSRIAVVESKIKGAEKRGAVK